MKPNFRICAIVFIFSFLFIAASLNADSDLVLPSSDVTISMDFQDARLKDILKALSIQSGLNFIASEAVQDRLVTLYFDKVPLGEAIDKLFKANNLSYDFNQDSNIIIVKDWGRPGVETVTKIFRLQYATVSTSSLKEEMSKAMTAAASTGSAASPGAAAPGGTTGGGTGGKWAVEEDSGITRTVKKLLSENGVVIEDFRTNSLIVTDIPSRMPVISQTIAVLDIPVAQVMLEVEMLDVSKNTIDRLGIKYADDLTTSMFTVAMTGASFATGFPFPGSFYKRKDFDRVFTPGTVGISNTAATSYSILLDFIKQQSDTKFLARPKILTLDNEPAEIKIATQEAIGTITTTKGEGSGSEDTTSAERVETGVTLRVTPQINLEKNEITMFIVPTVKDTSVSTFNPAFKDPEERSSKSMVRVKDGETVIIGGLIRNDSSQIVTKLPFLGDIPLLGSLFRHKYKDKDRERELLVFITPHIVRDSVTELAQARKVVFPEREQDTASGFDRQAFISASLNNFEQKGK